MGTGENSGTRVHSRVSEHTGPAFPPQNPSLCFTEGSQTLNQYFIEEILFAWLFVFFLSEKEHIEPLEVLGCVF